jgi:hypothetical protein
MVDGRVASSLRLEARTDPISLSPDTSSFRQVRG